MQDDDRTPCEPGKSPAMSAAIEMNPDAPRESTDAPSRWPLFTARSVTLLIVVGPIVALAVAVPLFWGHIISIRDIAIAAVFYLFSGFGVTVGYHRLFTHRS